jgi:hypothetical protein
MDLVRDYHVDSGRVSQIAAAPVRLLQTDRAKFANGWVAMRGIGEIYWEDSLENRGSIRMIRNTIGSVQNLRITRCL